MSHEKIKTFDPGSYQKILKGLCPLCKKEIWDTSFRDALSRKEYSISGMCQECQDGVFDDSDNEDPFDFLDAEDLYRN